MLTIPMMLVNFTVMATTTDPIITGICGSAKWFFGLTDEHEYTYTVSDFSYEGTFVALGGHLKDAS